MATISAYETKAGKRYRVRYTTPDRRETSKRGFTNKRTAQEWLAENAVKINTGEWRSATAGRISVSELADEWIKTKVNLTPKTMDTYQGAVNHIKNVGSLGATYVKDVDMSVVEKWVAAMGQERSPKTVRNSFGVLNQVLGRAVRDKRIPANPCKYVELPKVPKKDMCIVPPAAVETMAVAAGGNYGDLVRFLAYTGLRWGEFAGLQVQDIDLPRHRLHIRHTITELNGKLVHGAPKHDKQRLVPLIAQAEAILVNRIKGKEPEDLVFTTTRGTPLRVRNARRDWFNKSAKVAGYPSLTPHDLRHSFASVAIASGASIKALQLALGHHSAAFTIDRYGHLFPDDYAGFTATMSATFAGNIGQKPATDNKAGQDV
ncbi:tyrosine-type recombinase/integrase [Corynebacterium glutamicum]|uniref:tyrosine-type recombinase/integrase n=1 Tax=Corynebacterium glutamicum TaxID=1718 RepID=UPI001B8B9D2E|nr:tyrosine-type recombinase/integrase [Corynebacterium glutamicum]